MNSPASARLVVATGASLETDDEAGAVRHLVPVSDTTAAESTTAHTATVPRLVQTYTVSPCMGAILIVGCREPKLPVEELPRCVRSSITPVAAWKR